MKQESIITLKNIAVQYQEKLVLAIDSLIIPAGILMAIIGPNGAGKSTLVKSILHKVKINAGGEITIFQKMYKDVKKKIAYIPQKEKLDWEFPINVFDFVLMGSYGQLGWLTRPGKQEKQKTYEVLQELAIEDLKNRQIGELSGGEKQRIFIARALVQNSEIFILDEPFQGIDSKSEKNIITILKALKKKGKTIIVVHHDLSKVREYFNWVLMLNKKPIAFGPTQKVFTTKNIFQTYSN